MRSLSKGATIIKILLLFCFFFNGNFYGLKRDVSVIGLILKRGWCSGVKLDKQILEIDLGSEGTLSGVASRKDDTVAEFALSYKKNNDESWYFYTENGSIKIFRVKKKSKGRFSRHWLPHKITARYVKFHAKKWINPLCLHVEIYGWKKGKMHTDSLRKNSGRFPIFQKLSMDREGWTDGEELEKDLGELHRDPEKPTPYIQEKKSNMNFTITMCFLATGIIAVLALIIVCKWEKHERKIRPDYLRANLRDNLETNLKGTKRK